MDKKIIVLAGGLKTGISPTASCCWGMIMPYRR